MGRRSLWSWVFIDVGNSAFSTTILAAVFPVYLPSIVPKEGVTFQIFDWSWTSSAMSLWAYTVSMSTLLTFLVSPVLGAWADEGGHRKRLLGIFTAMGAFTTIALGFTHAWTWSLIFFIFANIGFRSNNIMYDALLPNVAAKKDWDRVSLQGFAWGYIAGGLILALNLAMIKKPELFFLENATRGLEWSFISVGLWWFFCTVPALLWIKEESLGRSVPLSKLGARFRTLGATLKSLPKRPMLLLFILAYAFFYDAIQTVISMSTIFGKEALALGDDTLIGTLLMIQFLGLPFTLGMSFFAKKFGAKRALMGSLIAWLAIVGYAYTMSSARDFWILGVMVSIVLGVSQALPRSIYAGLIPKGKQAEYFSFFALAGKMTSVIGPAVFGLVRDATGDARLSVLSLGVLFIIGTVLLSFVSIDPEKSTP